MAAIINFSETLFEFFGAFHIMTLGKSNENFIWHISTVSILEVLNNLTKNLFITNAVFIINMRKYKNHLVLSLKQTSY